jgi:hypothetical protein
MGSNSNSAKASRRFLRVAIAGIFGVLSPELLRLAGLELTNELLGPSLQISITAALVALDKAVRSQLNN